jgi:ribonuclease HI
MENWATLYTDASGRGGYGIHGICNEGKMTVGGCCGHRDSLACELYAIVKGVEMCASAWDIDSIRIRSDSRQALRLASTASNRTLHSTRADLKALQERLARIPLQVTTEWVRGHQAGNSSSAYLNRKVDKLAREHSRGTG